jgi:23S rRNA pseudouridine2605 synthase
VSEERIQKVLAEAGIASRRAIETMIDEGRIQVNGEPATLGQKVGPGARITVDGRAVRHSDAPLASRVLLYKKRTGELVTKDDPEGRRTVFRKLPVLDTGRWIAVGRLDINTSGLLLLTNDGDLAKRLTHPSYEISREYAVRVLGEMTKEILDGLRKGVPLEDGMAHFDSIDRGENEDGEGANQWWRVKLKEGRNREVRRLFESQGLQVSRLIRVAYGPIKLGRGVQSGGWRELDADELKELRRAVGFDTTKAKAASKTRRVKGKDDEELLPARKPTKRDLERLDKAVANAKKIKPDRDAKPSGWSGYKARKPS